jgi:hypothetical protein
MQRAGKMPCDYGTRLSINSAMKSRHVAALALLALLLAQIVNGCGADSESQQPRFAPPTGTFGPTPADFAPHSIYHRRIS